MNDKLAEALRKAVPWAKPPDFSKCGEWCGSTEGLKVVDVRGCNAYGDREVRRMAVCKECRKRIRGLYRLVKK